MSRSKTKGAVQSEAWVLNCFEYSESPRGFATFFLSGCFGGCRGAGRKRTGGGSQGPLSCLTRVDPQLCGSYRRMGSGSFSVLGRLWIQASTLPSKLPTSCKPSWRHSTCVLPVVQWQVCEWRMLKLPTVFRGGSDDLLPVRRDALRLGLGLGLGAALTACLQRSILLIARQVLLGAARGAFPPSQNG